MNSPLQVNSFNGKIPEDIPRRYAPELSERRGLDLQNVNPLTYDITAIVKHLGALKKFPVLIFERPLNAHGRASDMQLVMGAENSQKKIQVALGSPTI